jgi:adenosine deaminase
MTAWASLPKVELHCHLLGTIGPALLKTVRRAGGRILVEPEDLDKVLPVSDLDSFRRWLDVLRPYQAANVEVMRPVLAAHAAALIEQNVVYAEIMLSPTMFPRERDSLLGEFGAWRDWAVSLEQGKLQIEFVMVVPRTLATELIERDTVNFLALRRAGLIAGVALVGIETGESLKRFAPWFERWRDAGLGLEIHAGEHTGPESVRDALEFGSPGRLGHALSAFADEELVDRIGSMGVHIEFCLTSNVGTGAVRELSEHPIHRARQLGLSFSLNTDDPGAFDCTMNGEYGKAADAFGFTENDFRAIYERSLSARFAPALRYPGNSITPRAGGTGSPL